MSDRVTFVGHSTVRLELGGTTLLTDPLTRGRFLHVFRHAPPVSPAVTDGVDAVLVSHLHADHLDFRSLRPVGKDVEVVVTVGGGRLLGRHGYRRTTELDPGDSTRVGTVEVTATDAHHDGRRIPIGRHVEALGYVIRAPSATVYFAGDTDVFPEMAELGEIDVALLPICGWGPKSAEGEGHLDPRSAAEAAALIKPRVVVPIHWGTYLRAGLARTRPDLLTDPPRRLVEEVARQAPGVEVSVLQPGQSLELA